MARFTRFLGVAAVGALVLAGCGGDDDSSSGGQDAPATTTVDTVPAEPVQVLVTNDDGVDAAGIDAVVNGLKELPNVEVTVVAPATNQSGKGGSVTDGPLTAAPATTASGFPATAVTGTPADTIVWAIDQKGIDFTPDIVVSGINAGQNMGPIIDASGTVGAARAAAQRGIPALAASQGGLEPPHDWASGVSYVLDWFEENLAAIADGTLAADTVTNMNIPTCATGEPRGDIDVPLATSADGYTDSPDCQSTVASPPDDIAAFLDGFVPISLIPITPATSG